MCGISCVLYCCSNCRQKFLERDLNAFQNIKHRGPDKTSIKFFDNGFFGFHLLSQIGKYFSSDNNLQPFIKNNNEYFVCNGEFYNFNEFITSESKNLTTLTNDCFHIFYNVVSKYQNDINTLQEIFTNKINGEFAFCFFNTETKVLIVGRDDFGVRPLFFSKRKCFEVCNSETLIFSSEAKGIYFSDEIITSEQFSPGKIFYTTPNILLSKSIKSNIFINENLNNLKDVIINSVKKRVLHFDSFSEKRIGCLLSGGVDSSLITAIAFITLVEEFSLPYARDNFYVFTIYYDNCSEKRRSTNTNLPDDVLYAKKLVEILKIKHHYIFSFNCNDALVSLPFVINCIESFDTTTIRASVPQFILASKIKKEFPFIRFLLTGEGADEIFGGYKYLKGNSLSLFYDTFFNSELNKLINNIHFFDGLRTDRTISNFSIEVRVPFLDKDIYRFVKTNYSLKDLLPSNNIEKFILRNCFKDYHNFPTAILFRPKEAFSDSVSSKCDKTVVNWFNILFGNIIYENNYYMNIFNHLFNKTKYKSIPYRWLPDPFFTNGVKVEDPSATILNF